MKNMKLGSLRVASKSPGSRLINLNINLGVLIIFGLTNLMVRPNICVGAQSTNITPSIQTSPAVGVANTITSLGPSSPLAQNMEVFPSQPNTFGFKISTTTAVPISCNAVAASSSILTCTWFKFTGTSIASATQVTSQVSSDYQLSSPSNSLVNCKLTVTLTANLANSFYCSASDSITGQSVTSDFITFFYIAGGQSNSGFTLAAYSYQFLPNSYSLSTVLSGNLYQYSSKWIWWSTNTTSCGVQCSSELVASFPNRYVVDDMGNLHAILPYASDVPYQPMSFEGDYSPYMVLVKSNPPSYASIYSIPTITTSVTPPTSTTATLRWVTGTGTNCGVHITGAVSTATCSLTINQGATIYIACIYSNKVTPPSVIYKNSQGSTVPTINGVFTKTATLADSGTTYSCYEAASPSQVSTIAVTVTPQLNWPTYTSTVYAIVNSTSFVINASSVVGPSSINFAWTINGQAVSGTYNSGWQQVQATLIQFNGPLQKSNSAVIRLQLTSGSQMRNYAFAFIVIDSFTLSTAPFSGSPTVLSLASSSSFTVSALPDSAIGVSSSVNYQWYMKSITLSLIQSNAYICSAVDYTANQTYYALLYDSASMAVSPNQKLPALTFQSGGSANTNTMSINTPSINSSVIDSYRGCYCARPYIINVGSPSCTLMYFNGDVNTTTTAAAAEAGWPWWIIIIVVVVILLLLIILLIVLCCRQCGKSQTYLVDKREREQGNNPVKELQETGFKEHVRGDTEPKLTTAINSAPLNGMEKDMSGDPLDDYRTQGYGEGSVANEYSNQAFYGSRTLPPANGGLYAPGQTVRSQQNMTVPATINPQVQTMNRGNRPAYGISAPNQAPTPQPLLQTQWQPDDGYAPTYNQGGYMGPGQTANPYQMQVQGPGIQMSGNPNWRQNGTLSPPPLPPLTGRVAYGNPPQPNYGNPVGDSVL